jgi:hypothetical protein
MLQAMIKKYLAIGKFSSNNNEDRLQAKIKISVLLDLGKKWI